MHSFKSVTFKLPANYCTHKWCSRMAWLSFYNHKYLMQSPFVFYGAYSQFYLVSNNSPYIILEINASAFLKGTSETKWKSPFPRLGNPCSR